MFTLMYIFFVVVLNEGKTSHMTGCNYLKYFS